MYKNRPTAPLKVFVGCEPEQTLPFEVLKHSIQRKAPEVEVIAIHSALMQRGMSVDWKLPAAAQGRTPFSFHRFAVPELANYSGLAVYVDSDMLVFDDVHRMLDHVDPAADITAALTRPGNGRRPQISVLVFDAANTRFTAQSILEQLADGRVSYDELFYKVPIAKHFCRSLPYEWNDLEHYEAGATKLVHFTDMDQQPWLTIQNPLADLWVGALREAIDQGYVKLELVRNQVIAGNARPSLLTQIEKKLTVSQLRHRHRMMDLAFVPPHRVGFTMKTTWLKKLAQRALGVHRSTPGILNIAARLCHGIAYRSMKALKGGDINIK